MHHWLRIVDQILKINVSKSASFGCCVKHNQRSGSSLKIVEDSTVMVKNH